MKKEQKKVYVVGLKATKERPALWVELNDVLKFNKYIEKIGKRNIIKL